MTEEKLCPLCGRIAKMEPVSLQQEAEIKGKLVRFTSPALKCSLCGNEMFTPEQMDESLRASREAYERQYASPSPDELIALRERYGASQKAFSLLLGFGELTMNSYERGSIPDSTNRLLIKLAENPVCFKEMYRINKDKIGLMMFAESYGMSAMNGFVQAGIRQHLVKDTLGQHQVYGVVLHQQYLIGISIGARFVFNGFIFQLQ